VDPLGRLLWWYVDTLFGATCFGVNTLWRRHGRKLYDRAS